MPAASVSGWRLLVLGWEWRSPRASAAGGHGPCGVVGFGVSSCVGQLLALSAGGCWLAWE